MKRVIGLIMFVAGLASLFTGSYMLFHSRAEEEKKQSEKKEETKKEEVKEWKTNVSGVYQSEDGAVDVTLFGYGSMVSVVIVSSDGGFVVTTAERQSESEFASSIFDTYKFKMTNDGFELTYIADSSMDEEEKNTLEALYNQTFVKTGEYTNEDYYNDNIGDLALFNSEWNGWYQSDDGKYTLHLYQIKDTVVRVRISGKNTLYDLEFDIVTDESGTVKLVNEHAEVSMVITEDKIQFVLSETAEKEAVYTSSYTKKGALTLEEVLKVEFDIEG